MVVVDVICCEDDCIHILPGRQQLTKAEWEWFLRPDIVVSAAKGGWEMPTRLRQIVADGCNR